MSSDWSILAFVRTASRADGAHFGPFPVLMWLAAMQRERRREAIGSRTERRWRPVEDVQPPASEMALAVEILASLPVGWPRSS